MRKKVQVHYVEPDGTAGVINYLDQDNVQVASEHDREFLIQKATKIASEWAKIFPKTLFKVVEI